MSRVRVAVFVSGGPIALAALETLAAVHRVVAVVRDAPRSVRRRLSALAGRAARSLGLRPPDPVAAWASDAGVPVLYAAGDGAAKRIRSLSPDIGCIATFPRRVPEAWIAACGGACLNVHGSLLPRHRGANPLFWTYHAGDSAGGVTVHVATPRFDAGGILLQERFGIERGEPVLDVHARVARTGARLLVEAVSGSAGQRLIPRDQDEAFATEAPSPVPGRRYADLAEWPAEQAWHFLAGLSSRYREPLLDDAGRPVRYSSVAGYEQRDAPYAPGTVVRAGAGWHAWTFDGVVHLAGAGGHGAGAS